MALRSRVQLCQEVPAKQPCAQTTAGIEPRHCLSEAMPLGLAQSDVFPHPCSILGKKKIEKWQLLFGPPWLLNSKRILTGLRTGKREAGPRKRMQQPGGLRSPVAPGAFLGLRVKAQVTATHLGRKSCQLLVSISSSPSLFSQTHLNSFHVCKAPRKPQQTVL